MPIIVLQHSPTDTLGRLGPILRDLGFRLDIRRLDLWAAAGGKGPGGVPPDFDDVDGVISLGGPANVGDAVAWMQPELDYLREAHRRQLAVVGICLGHQMVAAALGGEVGPATKPEVGFARVSTGVPGQTDTILSGIAWATWQFQVHAQEVKKVPPDATVLQSSADCKVQCFRAGLRTYGFQYHFECTRADIEEFARDAFTEKLLQQNGLSAGELRAQTDSFFDDYERLGTRLCENLGTYLWPILARLK
jgi:GMP synthase-like glutamine amidotransferase